MRFVDFLRVTVLLSAAAATALMAVTVIAADRHGEPRPEVVSVAWWLFCALVGILLGRRSQAAPAIGRLLAGARVTTTLPEPRPWRVLVNRLWPLALLTAVTGALAFIAPQVPGVAAGLPIVLALYWRRQDHAVAAIEERDGVLFYVRHTSPLRPMELERIPGLRALRPLHSGAAS